jgi:hypothetical protein
MLKSIKTILLISTILFSTNTLANELKIIDKEINSKQPQIGKQITVHFITKNGVECIERQSTGYKVTGLSCNWEAYNKKKELQAHNSHVKAINESEIAHEKVLNLQHDIFDKHKEEFKLYSISIKNNIRLLKSMNKEKEAEIKLAEYNIKLAHHVVAVDTHHRNYGFRNTCDNILTTAMVNPNNEL